MPTYTPKAGDTTHEWYVIDATDVVLGRLAVAAANLLRGKHKPTFTPNVDGGDFVIVINAEKVKLTGNKEETKIYKKFTGFPSGLKLDPAKKVRQKDPTRIVEQAVAGMLPRNKARVAQLKRLKIFVGDKHDHAAQQPQTLAL